jgi:LysR family cyn operon transcriptional activator
MVTLMPDAAVRWDSHPDLVVKPLSDGAGKLSFRQVGLVWVTGGHRTAAACAFASEVKAVIKKDARNRPGHKTNTSKAGN